jgi:hypothetical protein
VGLGAAGRRGGGGAKGRRSCASSARGHVTPAVLQLAREERAFTLVLQPFLRDVDLYEGRVDYLFNEEDRDASL